MANYKTLRERVEDNIAVYLLSAVVAGFAAGWVAYQAVLRVNNRTSIGIDELATLKQRSDAFLKDQQERGPAKQPAAVLHAEPPLPDLEGFLNTPLQGNYQWDGYRMDVNELQSSVKRFLDYLENHPATTYAETQSFYSAIDEAASVVVLNAQKMFVPDRESDGPCNPKYPYFNQKVYIGPSSFIILVEELREQHRRAPLTHDLISMFQNQFNEWRKNEGI